MVVRLGADKESGCEGSGQLSSSSWPEHPQKSQEQGEAFAMVPDTQPFCRAGRPMPPDLFVQPAAARGPRACSFKARQFGQAERCNVSDRRSIPQAFCIACSAEQESIAMEQSSPP